jgi:hypothetical protein
MGNAPITTPIVSVWGKKDSQTGITGPRYDSIDIRPNKQMALTAIGVVRPVEGEGYVSITIYDLRNRKQVYYEEFTLVPNFLETSYLKSLKGKVVLDQGMVYRIRVNFQGQACYTFLEGRPFIKEEELEIDLRKAIDEAPDGKYRMMNLMTDLQCKVSDKNRQCMG